MWRQKTSSESIKKNLAHQIDKQETRLYILSASCLAAGVNGDRDFSSDSVYRLLCFSPIQQLGS